MEAMCAFVLGLFIAGGLFLRLGPRSSIVILCSGAVRINALVVQSYVQKRVGLLNHINLSPGEALFFPRCRAVHTKGMHFAIDILFLDQSHRVMKILEDCNPNFKGSYALGGARAIVELRSGEAKRLGIKDGACFTVLPTMDFKAC